MDFKFVWTALAREDLQDIVRYIAQNDAEAARRRAHGPLSSLPAGSRCGHRTRRAASSFPV